MTIKQELLQVCNNQVTKRINDYKSEIEIIKESISSNEGSKSEEDDGGNGKLFNDLEKNVEHLNDAYKTQENLKLVKTNIESPSVILGSIVKTNTTNFYIAISIGKITVNNEDYFAISLSSPIGQLLKNKTVGETIEFNQNKYTIKAIL